MDHCKYTKDFITAGINVYGSGGTLGARSLTGHHRAKTMTAGTLYNIGSFKVKPFDVQHNAAEPFGFLINHKDCGNTLFITDSYFSEYTFTNLSNVIVEANYDQAIMDERAMSGRIHSGLRNQIMTAHMSLSTCIDLLKANDLSKVNNFILIHLSQTNSNAKEFQKAVMEATGKRVTVAEAGAVINLSTTPF